MRHLLRWFMWMLPGIAFAQLDPMDEFAEEVREATAFQSEDGQVSLDMDFYFTMDNWGVSQPPPGIMQNSGNYLASPRLSVLGQNTFYDFGKLFVLGRLDRGFDPTQGSAQVRPDEYYFQADPADGLIRLTAGKFGTGLGQWSRRYFEWDNPMVNAPLTYEWITTVGDGNAWPTVSPSARRFLNRRNEELDRTTWVPVIWGPAYTTGFRLDGTVETFDYNFELRNNAPSSRPTEWNLWNHGFYANGLTYAGRLGWRPAMDWNLGLNASSGAYLVPGSPGVPAGKSWSDYNQTLAGMDVSWAHGPWQVWAEGWWSSFEVPGPVGTVSLWSYFIEPRWKFAPGWWLAGRWNQQVYGEIANPNGGYTPWGNDVWRIDACVGWSINRTTTLKLQYSYTGEAGPIQQGQHVGDFQMVFAF